MRGYLVKAKKGNRRTREDAEKIENKMLIRKQNNS